MTTTLDSKPLGAVIPTHKSCSCGCSPCICPTPTGFGCLPDMCVLRPCFFDGQLISAQDLNAVMDYLRTKDAIFARFVSGWGVLGGLRIDAAPGVKHEALGGETQRSPNPQILAGTTVVVKPGVAIDARGQSVALCSPCVIDIAELAKEVPKAPETQPCAAWFAPQTIDACGGEISPDLTATSYWLVAEIEEVPVRPVPQFAGGGPCDPAPSCDFSRKREELRLRLVPQLPPEYLFTGCVESTGFELPTPPEGEENGGASAMVGPIELSETMRVFYEFMDALNERAADVCCQQPAVVLGRVLLTADPGDELRGNLPSSTLYTIVMDGYPLRRVVPPAALHWLVTTSGNGGGGPE